MKLPTNGVAKELRHYIGSLFIFLLIMSIIFILMVYPVLETNKEVVMMLIGTISASIGLVVSTITGSKPLQGAQTLTLTSDASSSTTLNKVGGDYDGSSDPNILQIECLDDNSANAVFAYTVATSASDTTP